MRELSFLALHYARPFEECNDEWRLPAADDFFYTYAKGETDRLYRNAVELLKRKNAIRRLARTEGRQLTEAESLVTLITPAAVRVFEQLTQLAEAGEEIDAAKAAEAGIKAPD